MNMNVNREWLLRAAENEPNEFVGGLMTRLAKLEALIQQAEEYGAPDFASELGLISLKRHRDELQKQNEHPEP